MNIVLRVVGQNIWKKVYLSGICILINQQGLELDLEIIKRIRDKVVSYRGRIYIIKN